MKHYLLEKIELLDTEECHLEELSRLKSNLNARKSKLTLKLSQAQQKKKKLDQDLVRKQQTLLHLKAELNSCVEGLSQKVENMKERKMAIVRAEGILMISFQQHS